MTRSIRPLGSVLQLLAASLCCLTACRSYEPNREDAAIRGASGASGGGGQGAQSSDNRSARAGASGGRAGWGDSGPSETDASDDRTDGGSNTEPGDAGSSEPGPAGDGGDARDAGPSAEDRCATTLGTEPGPRTLRVGDLEREYVLHLPESGSAEPRALVVDLHGLLGHADHQRASSGFATLADAEGFVVAYPNALDGAWSFGDCCAATPSDDVAFVRALVSELVASGCIDPTRIYAAGSSAGGGLAQTLACEAADVFAAIATRDFDLLEEQAAQCRPARPIAVLSRRSTDDPDMPYAGGAFRPINGLNVTLRSIGAIAAAQRWASLNGCDGTSARDSSGCTSHSGCEAEVEVRTCPASDPSADVADTWAFLSRFQRN